MATTAKRRTLYGFQTIHTLRYEVLHRAGIVCFPGGRPTLEAGSNPAVCHRFTRLYRQLTRAA